ncbi:PF20097 family protein [Petroclostridium sp. X23]|uniref:PF20097 family protein n=1 Tax=Petroclostridium sp. X23 TaxID=3045146 RepID=UPI0024ACE1CF|nr:PF20097 family protein [Petroclostridium sp. X23]WHH58260.1 PF20097 family protein [Petroclostridium sp. X23]
MKCPYCDKEMKYGVIESPHEINWKPKKAKLFGAARFHEGAIVLSKLSLLKGSCVEAYCCDNCKKIIIYYDGNNAE